MVLSEGQQRKAPLDDDQPGASEEEPSVWAGTWRSALVLAVATTSAATMVAVPVTGLAANSYLHAGLLRGDPLARMAVALVYLGSSTAILVNLLGSAGALAWLGGLSLHEVAFTALGSALLSAAAWPIGGIVGAHVGIVAFLLAAPPGSSKTLAPLGALALGFAGGAVVGFVGAAGVGALMGYHGPDFIMWLLSAPNDSVEHSGE